MTRPEELFPRRLTRPVSASSRGPEASVQGTQEGPSSRLLATSELGLEELCSEAECCDVARFVFATAEGSTLLCLVHYEALVGASK